MGGKTYIYPISSKNILSVVIIGFADQFRKLVTGASINFSDWGGGAKIRKISKILQCKTLRAKRAQKLKILFFSSFYVTFNSFVVPESAFSTYSYIS